MPKSHMEGLPQNQYEPKDRKISLFFHAKFEIINLFNENPSQLSFQSVIPHLFWGFEAPQGTYVFSTFKVMPDK